MPAARATAPTSPPDPEPEQPAEADSKSKSEAPAAEADAPKEPTAWEYTWGDPTAYSHIPLTAYPPRPAEPAQKDAAGVVVRDAVPARPATVFAFVEPPDNRWRPTDLPMNQAKDNEAPLTTKGA